MIGPETVSTSVAVGVVVVSVATALATGLLLRARLPAPAVAVLLGLAGAGVAYGGMMLRAPVAMTEVILAVLVMALLVPAHAWIVLGPFGRRR